MQGKEEERHNMARNSFKRSPIQMVYLEEEKGGVFFLLGQRGTLKLLFFFLDMTSKQPALPKAFCFGDTDRENLHRCSQLRPAAIGMEESHFLVIFMENVLAGRCHNWELLMNIASHWRM